MRQRISLVFGLVLLLGGTLVAVVYAAQVEPVVVTGNPTCSEIDPGSSGIKIDPPVSGTYQQVISGVTVTLQITVANTMVSFDSNVAVEHVVVKGGDSANDYDYTGMQLKADQGLSSPLNNGGNVPAVSHVDFCWKNPPTAITLSFLDATSHTFPSGGFLAAFVLISGFGAIYRIHHRR